MKISAIIATAAVAASGILGISSGVGATAPIDPGIELDTAIPEAPPEAPVVASTAEFSLPILGAPLVVDISTDPGGNLVDVALNPSDGYTATTVKENKVRFVSEDGTVSVRVKNKRGSQRIDARAASIADISGPGGWSGDVFGTGDTTEVGFDVGVTATGTPDITGVTVNSTVEHAIGATTYESGDDDAAAMARIEFSAAGQTRTLSIKAKIGGHHRHIGADDSTADDSARLSISLSKIRGRQMPDGEAVGPHSWTGQLCDGSMADVSYVVAADGAITDVVATPDAEVGEGRRSTRVEFATGERIDIKVNNNGGALTVGVAAKIRCDAQEPAVNTPVDTPANDSENHHRGDRGKRDQAAEQPANDASGAQSNGDQHRGSGRDSGNQGARQDGSQKHDHGGRGGDTDGGSED